MRTRTARDEFTMSTPTAIIIEDAKDIAEIYRHILTMVGFECELIPSGKRAEKRLAEIVPDLIILDLRLEDDRVSSKLLARVRQDERFDDTVIFIATGHPRLAEPLQDSADLVLQKPIDIRFLTHMAIKLASKKTEGNVLISAPISGKLIDRQYFMERLDVNLEEVRKYPEHLFFIFLIKVQIMEFQGERERQEAAREAVNNEITTRLIMHTRLGDSLALLGADEYGVILYNIRHFGDVWSIADWLVKSLKPPVPFADGDVKLKISMGAVVSSPIADAEIMMQIASRALLQAQSSEDGKFVILSLDEHRPFKG